MFVKQRAKLSRLGVETASKSFHLHVSSSGVLAGGIWSVLRGYYCRNSQTPFGSSSKQCWKRSLDWRVLDA